VDRHTENQAGSRPEKCFKTNRDMTAKDKANELGNKFYEGSVFASGKQGHLDEIARAKNRAIICVDEILNSIDSIEVEDFYTQVKQEIENL
jgi:hypothetical protein